MLQRGRKQANHLPGEGDRKAYLKSLRCAADQGDINAMGWLVFLANCKGKKSHEPQIKN